MKRPIAIDLFSGAGGMSLGFEQAGYDIALAVDSDPYHVAVHRRNFPYGIGLTKSVVDLSVDELRSTCPGPISLVFGGPPCQGFSSMGLRDVEDPRNSLVNVFLDLALGLAPEAIVIENVPGMGQGKTAPILNHAVGRLCEAGYLVTEPVRALSADDYGVPQARARLFILAIRVGIASHPIVYPSCAPAGAPPTPTVAESIGDLPIIERASLSSEWLPQETASADSLYARVAQGLVDDPSDFSRPRTLPLSKKGLVSGCLGTRHSESTMELYSACAPGTMVPGHKLPKLDPDGIAPTLRAGTGSSRGSHTAPRPVHYRYPRVITAREAARLHGYPDWFAFYPKKWHAYRQIGNSVCPPVARSVGLEIQRCSGRDPAQLDRPTVQLLDEFPLDAVRPKVEKRRSHSIELRKVFDALWRDSRRTESDSFGEEEIGAAITASGADLPRVRPGLVLGTLARFRGAAGVLSSARSEGFTVLVEEGPATRGRWVELGTLGAIGETKAVTVSSAELKSPLPLRLQVDLQAPVQVALLAEQRLVSQDLFGCEPTSFRLERDILGSPALRKQVVPLNSAPDTKSKTGRTILWVRVPGRLPQKRAVLRRMAASSAQTLLLFVPLTTEHLFAARFERTTSGARETSRRVYRIQQG